MAIIWFVIAFVGAIILTLIIQLISKMKIVGGNELGVIGGKGGKKGFTTLSGGRIFVIPLFHKFSKIDLTPHTIEVVVDSAIAAGVVPLNVKATVSFAISSSSSGRSRAVTRILRMTQYADRLRDLASSIIEGHLRDAIASMTPEQVMQDKDTLVANMINVCKNDLENIGLEITTMNIADVDDHRLQGVDEPDLYIALLKRVQTANAECQARIAKANADAAAKEQEEQRRAEIEVRQYENLYEKLQAETKVKVATENQRRDVGVEQATKNASAQVSGLISLIEAEKHNITMLEKKYEAEVIVPAAAEKERLILSAKTETAIMLGKAQAEIEKLQETIEIINNKSGNGSVAYLIENFERLIKPFSSTLALFPANHLTVITGAEGQHQPISAIHPHAIDERKNEFLTQALAGVFAPDVLKKVKDQEKK